MCHLTKLEMRALFVPFLTNYVGWDQYYFATCLSCSDHSTLFWFTTYLNWFLSFSRLRLKGTSHIWIMFMSRKLYTSDFSFKIIYFLLHSVHNYVLLDEHPLGCGSGGKRWEANERSTYKEMQVETVCSYENGKWNSHILCSIHSIRLWQILFHQGTWRTVGVSECVLICARFLLKISSPMNLGFH